MNSSLRLVWALPCVMLLAPLSVAVAQSTPTTDLSQKLKSIALEQVEAIGTQQAPVNAESFPAGTPFLVEFTGNVDRLESGAPVTVLGRRVGTVRQVSVQFDSARNRFVVPVLLDIVPELLAVDGQRPATVEATEAVIAALVEQGLRARVSRAGLLDPTAHVSLDMDPDAPNPGSASPSSQSAPYPMIPPGTEARAELRAALEALIARVDNLPLEEIAEEALLAVRGTREAVTGGQIEKALAKLTEAAGRVEAMATKLEANAGKVVNGVASAAGQAERSAAAIQQSLGPRAPIWRDLDGLMSESTNTLRSLRLLVDYLERHPEALLTGKQE